MMVQALSKNVTFDQFIEWLPEDGRYELIDGEVIELAPSGRHERKAGWLSHRLWEEIEAEAGSPLFIPKTCIVRPYVDRAGYMPDVIVLDETQLGDEPDWEKKSTICRGQSARLVVEIASGNWKDDYLTKLAGYESMGIAEYWIVDYMAFGAIRYIGEPKQPTLSVYYLQDGEYRVRQFRGRDRVESQVFPNLQMEAIAILG
jgi:Uma2 family endonuclease